MASASALASAACLLATASALVSAAACPLASATACALAKAVVTVQFPDATFPPLVDLSSLVLLPSLVGLPFALFFTTSITTSDAFPLVILLLGTIVARTADDVLLGLNRLIGFLVR